MKPVQLNKGFTIFSLIANSFLDAVQVSILGYDYSVGLDVCFMSIIDCTFTFIHAVRVRT